MHPLIQNHYKRVSPVVILVMLTHVSMGLDPHRFIPSRGKPVVMSSTEGDHVGSYATDGNYNNNDGDFPFKYSETLASTDPYLQIDLGYSIFVDLVQVNIPIGKKDNKPIKITVGDDATVGSAANVACTSAGTFGESKRINCQKTGRYLAVQKFGDNVKLYASEVAVHNIPVENLAYMKTAAASKELTSNYVAERATDMVISKQAITSFETVQWIRVDLEYSYLVREVILIYPTICCSYRRLHDFDIRIGNSRNVDGNSLCVSHQTMFPGEMRLFLCNMFGRYVTVVKNLYRTTVLSIAELMVNPETTKNLAVDGEPFSNVGPLSSGYPLSHINDMSMKKCFLSNVDDQSKFVRIDLGGTQNVSKVHIVNYNWRQDMLLSVSVSVGLDSDHGTSSPCQPGLDEHVVAISGTFTCNPSILGRYVFAIQNADFDRRMEICEMSVFEGGPPLLLDIKSNYSQWLPEHSDVTLTCNVEGYPVPTISWMKDNEVIQHTFSTLQLKNVSSNDSGRYECWANNTAGANAKPFYLSFYGKLLVCVRYSTINVVSGIEQEVTLYDDSWYKFWDFKRMKELEIKQSAPGSRDSCLVWLNGEHPTIQDGIVSRQLCVKNGAQDCSESYMINVRRCSTHYVYHFKNISSLSSFCLRKVQDVDGGIQPTIASPVKEYALSGKVFRADIKILADYECLMMCQLEEICKSFNYSKKLKICQLNHATKKEFPKNYVFSADYDYYEMGRGMMMATKVDL